MRRSARFSVLALGLLAPLLWLACSPGSSAGNTSSSGGPAEVAAEVHGNLSVPGTGTRRVFGDMPFPSDIDVDADGTRNVFTFPNPTNADMLEIYRGVAEKGFGWGLNGAHYMGFDAALDATDLPATPADTLSPTANVQLVDVDSTSPERGTRIPLRIRYREEETIFIPFNTLITLPVLGFPLRPNTTYALVVLDGVSGKQGGRVDPSADLKEILKPEAPADARLAHAYTAYAPLRAATDLLPLSRVVHATVFTTAHPLPELSRARDRVVSMAPFAVTGWIRPPDHDSFDDYKVYEGVVGLPQFQQGTAPYEGFDGESGGFKDDANGTPVVQRTEQVKFLLTIPKGVPPEGGWPTTVVATGTGGTYRSGLGNNFGDEANWNAGIRCATLTISQPLHETREGYREGQVELLTFNFLNPRAGIDNWRQSALESVALMHSLESFAVPADVSHTGAIIPLNTEKKVFFGHSQGGITGALMAGIEPDLDVAVLSGAGGGFAESLLEKTEPVVIKEAVKLVLSLPPEEDLDEFHPVLTFMQMLAEGLEPLNASRQYFVEGRKLPQILIFSGLMDVHTPPRTHGPLAAAARIPVLAPQGMEVEALMLRDIAVQPSPARENMLLTGDRHTTAVLAQFPNNDHFAIFRNPEAAALAARFVQTFLDTGESEAAR